MGACDLIELQGELWKGATVSSPPCIYTPSHDLWVPSCFELSHGTCFNQWDINEHSPSRGFKNVCSLSRLAALRTPATATMWQSLRKPAAWQGTQRSGRCCVLGQQLPMSKVQVKHCYDHCLLLTHQLTLGKVGSPAEVSWSGPRLETYLAR